MDGHAETAGHHGGEPRDPRWDRASDLQKCRGWAADRWARLNRKGGRHLREVGGRGPSVIGENAKIDPNAYIGPSTAIGDRFQISAAEIEDSVVMEGSIVSV
jgi:NDP-sugar pyrophosphorylase family protein